MKQGLITVFLALWCMALVGAAFGKRETESSESMVIRTFSEMGMGNVRAQLAIDSEWHPDSLWEDALAMIWKEEGEAVDAQSSTTAQIYELIETCRSWLSMEPGAEVIREEKQNGTVWSAEGKLEGFDSCHAVITVMKIGTGINAEYYLRIRAEVSSPVNQAESLRMRMDRCREALQLDGLISLRLCADYDRILSEEEMEDTKTALFSETGTKVIEEYQEDNLSMIYGQSEGLEESVRLGGQSVNLTLMYRNNGEKTRCFLGLPVVLSDD